MNSFIILNIFLSKVLASPPIDSEAKKNLKKFRTNLETVSKNKTPLPENNIDIKTNYVKDDKTQLYQYVDIQLKSKINNKEKENLYEYGYAAKVRTSLNINIFNESNEITPAKKNPYIKKIIHFFINQYKLKKISKPETKNLGYYEIGFEAKALTNTDIMYNPILELVIDKEKKELIHKPFQTRDKEFNLCGSFIKDEEINVFDFVRYGCESENHRVFLSGYSCFTEFNNKNIIITTNRDGGELHYQFFYAY